MRRVFGRIATVAALAAALAPAVAGIAAPVAGAVPVASLQATPCVPVLCDAAGTLARDAAGAAAQASLGVLVKWVGDGAATVLDRVGRTIDDPAEPHLHATWFEDNVNVMQGVAVVVLMPLLLVALIGAVIHQDPARLVRAVAVYLPAGVLGGFVAVQLTQVALDATDQLCVVVSKGMGNNVAGAVVHIGVAVQAATLPSGGLGSGGLAAFIVSIVAVIGAVLIWVELLLRSTAIYVAVLFLPLTLAGLVWPATSRWAKRLVEILVALVLSKFVIVAVISLAVSALDADHKDALAAGLAGAALLLLAGFAPFVLLRLVPVVEAGVIGHLEGTSRRPAAAGATSSQMVRRLVQSADTSGAAGPVAAGSPAAAGAAAGAGGGLMIAQAVGVPGFFDGLSGDDGTAAPMSAGPIRPAPGQPGTGAHAGGALGATGLPGAGGEAGTGGAPGATGRRGEGGEAGGGDRG